ncbi:uncharacterized protein BHQ10_008022 [Talaromyces amestolkiae]|uniref:Uncharacterized protein n=1 Tax=Talaromyces amestolkiae TaxID=1196081 RepID=A0A364L868_TALAM|nr:uncharacterized protein BHQ10_008022 [Talaromyces amestolkiae]RAO72010.1 hypothetical protein BHQ10_008022 [Talaromyces amestolkiae]
MIWLTQIGGAEPLGHSDGPIGTDVKIEDILWDLLKGANKGWTVHSYVAGSQDTPMESYLCHLSIESIDSLKQHSNIIKAIIKNSSEPSKANMANDDTNFALSTGNIATAIRDLPKRPTTAADVARLWLEILEIFFPDDQGFQRKQVLSTKDRVLIQVQRCKDLDGDVFIDSRFRQSILVVDCRGNIAGSSGLQFKSDEEDSRNDVMYKYGVASFGAQVTFLKDVSSLIDDHEVWSLRGVKMDISSLVRATGRDATEAWLRKIRDISDDLVEEHHS